MFVIILVLTVKWLYVNIKINLASHCIKILLDFKVMMNVIFIKFAQKIKVKNCKLEKQYLFGIVAECNSTWITKKMLLLTTKVLKHEKKIVYDIVNMASYNVILKYLWMKKHNLNIDWISQIIEFNKCFCIKAFNPHSPWSGLVDEDEILCNIHWIKQHK